MIGAGRDPLAKVKARRYSPDHTVPTGTGPVLRAFQALRARLPSSGPFGTKPLPEPRPTKLPSCKYRCSRA